MRGGLRRRRFTCLRVKKDYVSMQCVLAVDQKGGIGLNNKIPWHIPADLRRFKCLTEHHVVVMGRKTFESLPDSVRPLPNRMNVVITNHPESCGLTHPSVMFATFSDARVYLERCLHDKQDVFVIGGKQTLESFMPYIKTLHLTRIMNTFECDVHVGLNRLLQAFPTVMSQTTDADCVFETRVCTESNP